MSRSLVILHSEGIEQESYAELQNSPKDDYGVRPVNILDTTTPALLVILILIDIVLVFPPSISYGQLPFPYFPDHLPTIKNILVSTLADTSVVIPLNGNDIDPEDTLNFSAGVPEHGKFDMGSYRYTPKSGFTGIDIFTYKATDSQGTDSNVANITITVHNTYQL